MDLRKSIALFFVLFLIILSTAACTFPGFTAPQPSTPTVSLDSCPTVVCPPCEQIVITDEPKPTTTPALVDPTEEVAPTQSPTWTPEPLSWTYTVQEGSPAYIENIHHENEGDLWMSVGGQVFGADEQPMKFIVVKVIGQMAGNPVEMLGMSGSAHHYGPGGYEIALSPAAFDSSGNFNVTLFDTDLNQLSETFYFDTFADVQRVTTIINFVAVAATP
jgi:hypothetical protein